MPVATIRKYEAGQIDGPGRGNVTALAAAVDWPGGLDVALALVGEGPLSAEERRFLPAPVDLFGEVTKIWPQLSPRLQAAITEMLRAICEPHGVAGPDPANRGRSKTISTPHEPADGNGPVDRTRAEYI